MGDESSSQKKQSNLLFAHNTTPELSDSCYEASTKLYEAARVGDLERVQQLYENDNACLTLKFDDFRDYNDDHMGFQAIHIASYGGHREAVKWLVEQGVDIETEASSFPSTPLEIAIERVSDYDFAQYLVEELGSRINDEILHMVCEDNSSEGVLDMVKWLLRRGCDPNIPNDDNMTALHVACQRGNLSVAKWLVQEAKADTSDRSCGRTILHAACDGLWSESLDTVKYLVEELHMDPLETTEEGQTSLEIANSRYLEDRKVGMSVSTEVVEYLEALSLTKSEHGEVNKILTPNVLD